MQSAAGSAILEALAKEATRSEQAAEPQALGLIATRETAQQAIARLQTAGMHGVDPRLDMLRLNAALPKGTIG